MSIKIKSCRGICKILRVGKSAFARRHGKHRGDSPYRLSVFCTTCDSFVFRTDLVKNNEKFVTRSNRILTKKDVPFFCPCCDGKNLRGLYKKRMDNCDVVRVSIE